MIGCSHQTAAVDFRERLSFSADQAREAIRAFRERFPACELVLLSTCNRVELYTAAGESAPGKDLDGGPDRSEVIEFLAGQRQVAVDDLMDALIYRSGSEAVSHLFAVAATVIARPMPTSCSGSGSTSRLNASYTMSTAATMIIRPSAPAEKYSIFPWP